MADQVGIDSISNASTAVPDGLLRWTSRPNDNDEALFDQSKQNKAWWRFWSNRQHHGTASSSLPTSPLDESRGSKFPFNKPRKVVPNLPRKGTFRRQQSERRDNLEPVTSNVADRRAVSMDRKKVNRARDTSLPAVPTLPRSSVPTLMPSYEPVGDATQTLAQTLTAEPDDLQGQEKSLVRVSETSCASSVSMQEPPSIDEDCGVHDDELQEELEKKWILNLSMHFRDRSNREKFFVTYAETPSYWRRVTISMDYRDAQPGTLEDELPRLQYQRDKSARIYESIRESLADIQFYDTVTNLKLQTEHERLHVHVTEDVHEIIHHPLASSIAHLASASYRESDLVFERHLSGFVYKVSVNGRIFIKKEIPGPDAVDEFLYEINALQTLSASQSVIRFGGVVVDEDERYLKGLLIDFAEQGALIDILFDYKSELPWRRRERWAQQIVQGLSEIHEAGFVQGDFTLSNIVVDEHDNAKIIDINRRGCPLGWEPPELVPLVESKQRISMYIGVKSDIFQLGMVLWALAMEDDEPEVRARPLTLKDAASEIPEYYRRIVDLCLSGNPRDRRPAAAILAMFPETTRADVDLGIEVMDPDDLRMMPMGQPKEEADLWDSTVLPIVEEELSRRLEEIEIHVPATAEFPEELRRGRSFSVQHSRSHHVHDVISKLTEDDSQRRVQSGDACIEDDRTELYICDAQADPSAIPEDRPSAETVIGEEGKPMRLGPAGLQDTVSLETVMHPHNGILLRDPTEAQDIAPETDIAGSENIEWTDASVLTAGARSLGSAMQANDVHPSKELELAGEVSISEEPTRPVEPATAEELPTSAQCSTRENTSDNVRLRRQADEFQEQDVSRTRQSSAKGSRAFPEPVTPPENMGEAKSIPSSADIPQSNESMLPSDPTVAERMMDSTAEITVPHDGSKYGSTASDGRSALELGGLALGITAP